jgi:SAM-dependent methyltransferase
MNNYEFCADFAIDASGGRTDFRVLDYGCGAGEIVGAMCRGGLDAYGCETFYDGGDLSSALASDVRDRILRMQGDRIPFPDASFDLVVTNMVLEHVADLNVSVAEINRVLKPGARCLALFPHREVWREGHCNIPFLHRFSKGSAIRVYYAAALRSLGAGAWKNDHTPMVWSRNFCKWLDDWCHYRSYKEISATFNRHISPMRHIEADWIVKRKAAFSRLPRSLRELITWKMAGLVFVVQKPSG